MIFLQGLTWAHMGKHAFHSQQPGWQWGKKGEGCEREGVKVNLRFLYSENERPNVCISVFRCQFASKILKLLFSATFVCSTHLRFTIFCEG